MAAAREADDIRIPNVSFSNLLWDRCKVGGNSVAVIDNSNNGNSITFRQFYNDSRQCSAFLHNHGVKKGDVIALVAANSLDYLLVMMGIIGCGAAVTPCNPGFKEGEIIRLFNISQPRMIFVDEDVIDTIKIVKAKLPCIEEIFIIGRSEEFITLEKMLGSQHDTSCLDSISINPAEDSAVIPYSSGTTGYAKAVNLTHSNMVAIYVVYDDYGFLDEKSCMYSDRPMYHALGYGMALISLMIGSKLVVDKKFDHKKMLSAVHKYKVNHMCTVPPNLIRLVNAEDHKQYDISSLRSVIVSAASTPPDVNRKFSEEFGVTMIPGYGATEAFFIALSRDPEDALESAGTACPTVDIKILDITTSEECPPGVDGEILVRGPQVMKGYLANQGEPSDALGTGIDEDGWFGTGDVGHFDKHGHLYIVDRLREMIKYKGLQVSPTEIEAVLVSHPKVADAGVIAVPDSVDGELPKAYVVKKDQSLTQAEIHAFVKDQLVDYKQLRGGVEFIEEIPKSPPGKILRRELKKRAGL